MSFIESCQILNDPQFKDLNDMFSCLNSWDGGWVHWLFPLFLTNCVFFSILPSFSFPLFSPVTNVAWLFSKLPRRCVCFWKRPAYTEDCLSEPWTDKVHSVSCHYDRESRKGSPYSLLSSHSTWLRDDNTNSSVQAVPQDTLTPWGCVWVSFQMHPWDLHSLSVHTKSPGGAGLWAGSMIIPFRGSERSVVECSCH